MTSEKALPRPVVAAWILAVLGLLIAAGWMVLGGDPAGRAAIPKMTFAQCQASAERPGFTDDQGTHYSGGHYAVEYDNGVCTVQRP